MKYKIILIILGILLIGGGGITYQLTKNTQTFGAGELWYPSSGMLKPVVSTWGLSGIRASLSDDLTVGTLTSCDTIDADASGTLSCGSDASGTGDVHGLLNSDYFNDVLTASVSQGSLIIGNSTPKWSSLGIGASNSFLLSNGTTGGWNDSSNYLSLTHASISDDLQIGTITQNELWNSFEISPKVIIGNDTADEFNTGLFASASSYGIYGHSDSGYGIYGYSEAEGYGVYGYSASGYAIYADGRLFAIHASISDDLTIGGVNINSTYVPYTGATAGVDLGAFTLTVNEGSIFFSGGSIFLGTPSSTEILRYDVSQLGIANDVGTFAVLDMSSLTTDRTFTFPDITGTFLLATGSQDFITTGAITGTHASISDDLTLSGGLLTTGNVPLTIGDALTDSLTITLDGTGNAELTLPADVIGDADIDWGSGAGQVDLADFTGGISGAVVWDFGGATSFEIPNGASPTVDVAGEIALDTTGGQLIVYNGDIMIFMATPSFSFVISSASFDLTIPSFKRFAEPITIVSINCLVSGGTNRQIELMECDANGANCVDVDSAITVAATNSADDGSLSNSSIDANDWIIASTSQGDMTGTVNWITCTTEYKFTQQ